MRQAHLQSTRALSALMIVVGVAMVVSAVVSGGGGLSLGVLLGTAFTLLGAGRLYLSRAPRERA